MQQSSFVRMAILGGMLFGALQCSAMHSEGGAAGDEALHRTAERVLDGGHHDEELHKCVFIASTAGLAAAVYHAHPTAIKVISVGCVFALAYCGYRWFTGDQKDQPHHWQE